MENLLKVSIGIPAYNEEANIQQLLKSLLEQKQDNFELLEIIVASDGSSDKTVELAKGIGDSRIQVLDNKDRKGKVARVNELMEKVAGDIFIQFDADILMKDDRVIHYLVQPFIDNPNSDLVCGEHEALPPRTFVERIATFGEKGWEEAKHSLKDASGYRCLGQIRAFSRNMISKFRVPNGAENMEDVYSFFYAQKNNLNIVYAPNAVVKFRLVSTAGDYIKQLSRTIRVHTSMENFFEPSLVSRYTTMTSADKLKALVKTALKSWPHITIGYLILHAVTRFISIIKEPPSMYDTAHTSKQL